MAAEVSHPFCERHGILGVGRQPRLLRTLVRFFEGQLGGSVPS